MNRTRSRIALVAVVLAYMNFLGTRGVSGDEWQPISPEELKMTSLPEAPGAPAVYLYRQVDRNDSNRASSEYNYVRIKILTEEGRKYANVEIPFERGRYSVSTIRARTIKQDGSIANFDGKVYENTIVKSKTLKYLAKTFTMPDVQVGGIIEYHFNYDFEDNRIFSSYWGLSEELFTKHAQFTLKPYRREAWTVQWAWPAGLPLGTEPPKEGNDGIIRMTANNIPAFKVEEYMPPENEVRFRVLFIYHDELPERDVDKFWRQFGKKENGRADDFINKKKAMEQALLETVAAGDSQEVKLQKIYAKTQSLRNLSYETRKTEQEEKREKLKEIKNVEDVWKNKQGYGSQITWLFLGLARAAGFEAYPVFASTRNEYFFNKVRMNIRELDSNMVLVKLNGKEMYFDPGALYAPYGLLPWWETAVPGLKLDKDGGSWIQTGMPTSDDSRVERTADLKLTTEGELTGKLKLTCTGLEAVSRRLEVRNEDDTERKKYLEEQVKEYIPTGVEVELKNKPEWTNSSVPLVAEFELKVPGWASAAGKKALLPVELFGNTEKHMFEHGDRTWPVYFEYPFKKIDTLNIELPLGWQVGSLPNESNQDAKAAQYTLKVASKNGVLHIERTLRSDLMLIPKDSYPVLRNFFSAVRTKDDQQVVLQPGGAAASN